MGVVMKIYSDILTEKDVTDAFFTARTYPGVDIHIDAIRTWKPRKHAYGVEVWGASVSGRRSANGRDARAASWDDWGTVIALLYNRDPHARIGFYDNEADFVAKVRQYQPRGATLKFLDVLTNIREYDE
jgi:hypothetical protein